jgi:hypothetical protein
MLDPLKAEEDASRLSVWRGGDIVDIWRVE